MTQRATLTATDASEIGPGWRRIMVDCRHGASTGHVRSAPNPDAPQFSDAMIVRALLLKHFSEEGCRCTLELRRRYGLVKARP